MKAPGMQCMSQVSTQSIHIFDLWIPLIFSIFPEHWRKEVRMGWNDENQTF